MASLCRGVGYETPLILRRIHKTIFIQDVDEDLQLLDSYSLISVESDADIRSILETKGSALMKVSGKSEPKIRVTKFSEIEHLARYKVFSRYEHALQDEVRWQQMEDRAMEEEVARATKAFLVRERGVMVKVLPRQVLGKNKKICQEWDGVFRVRDTVYVCEAKHVMSIEKVEMFPKRIEKFEELLDMKKQPCYDGVKNVIGVGCGTLFPPAVLEEAQRLHLVCVFPSGMRYGVDPDFQLITSSRVRG